MLAGGERRCPTWRADSHHAGRARRHHERGERVGEDRQGQGVVDAPGAQGGGGHARSGAVGGLLHQDPPAGAFDVSNADRPVVEASGEYDGYRSGPEHVSDRRKQKIGRTQRAGRWQRFHSQHCVTINGDLAVRGSELDSSGP
jgi:hypothetical protein